MSGESLRRDAWEAPYSLSRLLLPPYRSAEPMIETICDWFVASIRLPYHIFPKSHQEGLGIEAGRKSMAFFHLSPPDM